MGQWKNSCYIVDFVFAHFWGLKHFFDDFF